MSPVHCAANTSTDSITERLPVKPGVVRRHPLAVALRQDDDTQRGVRSRHHALHRQRHQCQALRTDLRERLGFNSSRLTARIGSAERNLSPVDSPI